MTDDVVTNAKAQVATPADLAAAREARGLSQVDISQRIKLQVRQVNALEEGQWDALPGKSFVRGALRSYGKLLDVDVTALLDSIGGFAEPAEVQGMRPLDSALSRSSGLGLNGGGRGSPILWVIAGLIGVVALVLYFGADQDATRIRSWLPSGKTPAEAPANPAPATTPPAPTSGTAPSPAVVPGVGSQPGAQSSMASSTPSPSQATSQWPYQPAAAGAGNKGSPPVSGAAANSAASAAGSGPVLSALSVLPRGEPAAATVAAAPPPAAAASTVPVETGIAAVPTTPPRPATAVAAATTGVDAAVSLPAATSPEGLPKSSAGSAADSASVAGISVKGVISLKALGQDSWVEVRQADGTALHNGLIKSGDSIDLNGKPPYRLVLGNASHLALVYEGKAQDLAPHMRANNIARLQLP